MPELIDQELLLRYRTGTLTQLVNPEGKVDLSKTIKENCTGQSRLLVQVLRSVLGPNCQVDNYEFAYPTEETQPFVDRLYHLLLSEFDFAALAGEICIDNYNIRRKETHLCFYLANQDLMADQTIVSLIEGTKFNQDPLFITRQSAPDPDIEVAKLLDKKEINVLDAGIGQSTAINGVRSRLKKLDKTVNTYGINLMTMPEVTELSEPCFVGTFEDYPFPVGFDLIYSHISSAYYTPNIEKYVKKLVSSLNEEGVAMLEITNPQEWERVLSKLNVEHEFLMSIPFTEAYKYVHGKESSFHKYKPGRIDVQLNGIDCYQIEGVLIKR